MGRHASVEAPPPRPGALAMTVGTWVRTLAGEIGERNVFRPRALDAAARFIAEEWAGQGYRVRRHEYVCQGVPCANLEVVREGSTRPGEIVLVGAHYDSVIGSPGANDNASGVAALLELSRRVAGASPARTLRFVAFVNEEPPFFTTAQMGSHVYAADARRRGDDIRAMIALETLGFYSTAPRSQHLPPLFGLCYPDRGDFVAFISNWRSRRLLRRAVGAFRATTRFPVQSLAIPPVIPGVSWSDHRSFWRHGYPAVMVTDTALYRYPHYHVASDTPDRLSYPALERVVEGLAGVVAALAAGP